MLIQVLCARYSDEEYFLNRCKGNILILLKVDFGCQEWKDDDASCFISVYIVCELIEHMWCSMCLDRDFMYEWTAYLIYEQTYRFW